VRGYEETKRDLITHHTKPERQNVRVFATITSVFMPITASPFVVSLRNGRVSKNKRLMTALNYAVVVNKVSLEPNIVKKHKMF